MFANRYTCIIDACSLAGVLRRNILLSLAEAEFFRVRWSNDILSETEKAIDKILLKRSGDAKDSKRRTKTSVEKMNEAFDEARVEGYEHLLKLGNQLPDKNDAHVLAAAIHTRASMIVTENLKDFPQDILDKYNLEAKNSDEFIADTIELDKGRALTAISTMRLRFNRPELTPRDLLNEMEKSGLIATADSLKTFEDQI